MIVSLSWRTKLLCKFQNKIFFFSHSLIFFSSVPDAILQSKFSKSCQVLVKIMASHAANGTPGLLRPVSKVFSVTFQCKIYLCRTNSGSQHHLHYISLLQIGLKQCSHNLIIFINIMMYRVFVTCTFWRRQMSFMFLGLGTKCSFHSWFVVFLMASWLYNWSGPQNSATD